jgi:hypothetical protein
MGLRCPWERATTAPNPYSCLLAETSSATGGGPGPKSIPKSIWYAADVDCPSLPACILAILERWPPFLGLRPQSPVPTETGAGACLLLFVSQSEKGGSFSTQEEPF